MTFKHGHSGTSGNPERPDKPSEGPNLTQVLHEISKRGYFDKEGNVLPEVIQDWPKIAAQTFKDGKLKSTQLRRFYNKAKAIEQKLESGYPFDWLKEEIATLKPLAAAAVGRGNAPDTFNQFMEVNVHEAIKSEKSFTRGFIIHFQSIIAYTKYYEEKKGGR